MFKRHFRWRKKTMAFWKIKETRNIDWVDYQKCCRCWEFKTLDHFSLSRWIPHTVCKECKREYDKAYRARTKARRAQKQKIYRKKNLEQLQKKAKERYNANSEKYIARSCEYRRQKVKENWFAWEWFHEQARKFVKKTGLKFEECYLCKKHWKTELHHPSYEGRDMWSYVVPLCRSCHRRVEQFPEECPVPINLLSYLQKWK